MGVPNGTRPEIPSHFIGGNHLEAAPPSSVKDFVAQHDGHSVISSVGLCLDFFMGKMNAN